MLSRDMQKPDYFNVMRLSKFKREVRLYTHDDLETTAAENDHTQLILLGYVLDPFNPERTNQEILDNLLSLGTFSAITEGTSSLSGRFAIVYNTYENLNVFHDATGFREVYYCDNECEIACGSTPNILRQCLTLERNDEQTVNDFFNSRELDRSERCWIGTQTMLKGVSKLLPNHYVDMVALNQIRYWPVKERVNKRLEEVTDLFSAVLKGTYQAMSGRRYTIYHSLTAGWDSRVLLAHARACLKDMKFYFYRGFKRKLSADYLISKKISDKLNLNARFIDLDEIHVDEEFERIYLENNLLARPKLLKGYYDTYINKMENTMTVSGTMGNEIIRILSSINRNTADPVEIARLLRYDKVPYVISSIRKWLEDSGSLREKNHILVDMFCWEQFFGNWGALSSSEQDIVREEIRPFNNRLLLSSVLCLKDKYRYRDYPIIYAKAIKNQWPELLDFDVDIRDNRIKKIFRLFGVERLVDIGFHRMRTVKRFLTSSLGKQGRVVPSS